MGQSREAVDQLLPEEFHHGDHSIVVLGSGFFEIPIYLQYVVFNK